MMDCIKTYIYAYSSKSVDLTQNSFSYLSKKQEKLDKRRNGVWPLFFIGRTSFIFLSSFRENDRERERERERVTKRRERASQHEDISQRYFGCHNILFGHFKKI